MQNWRYTNIENRKNIGNTMLYVLEKKIWNLHTPTRTLTSNIENVANEILLNSQIPEAVVVLDDTSLQKTLLWYNEECVTALLPSADSRFMQLKRSGSINHTLVSRWQSSAKNASKAALLGSTDVLWKCCIKSFKWYLIDLYFWEFYWILFQ